MARIGVSGYYVVPGSVIESRDSLLSADIAEQQKEVYDT